MATSSTGNPACPEERSVYAENRRACATSRCALPDDMRGDAKFGSCALLLFASAAIFLFVCLSPALAQKTSPTQPLNLNTATIAQLETLPGIGPNAAKSIVDFRNRSGPFRRVEDLLAIKGISKSKLEKLRPYITVGPIAPNRHPDSPHQNPSSPNFQKAM